MDQYTHNYSLTAADMDTRYRMTPNAVLLYYQDCWARYMSCLHLAAFDVVKQNRIWVITEFNAWFEQQTALWSDEIQVTVWNSEVGALRLYAEFRVHRADGVEVAHGYGCWTLLDTEAHRLAPMTPFQPQIPVLPEVTSETHKKRRFPTDGTPLQQIEHRVNPINLDFNGHVNNRTYLSIAMQTVSADFAQNRQLRSLTIRWLRETFLGDTLICRMYDTANNTYLHVISKDDMPVAQIYSELATRTSQAVIDSEAPRV